MTTAAASLFFASMALIALAVTLAGLAVVVVARTAAAEAPVRRLRDDLRRAALPLGWLVATVATLGSLYYSEIAHFTPCKLCWFQRIAMYPLVLLLGIAAWRRDRGIRAYVIALAAIGAAVAAYHSWIQAFPPVGGSSFCTLDAPCTEKYVWEFGFVSLPFMALCGFAAIITAMLVAGPDERTAVEWTAGADQTIDLRPRSEELT